MASYDYLGGAVAYTGSSLIVPSNISLNVILERLLSRIFVALFYSLPTRATKL